MGKLLTRKQQWRRTRTRKHAWGDLPPEVLEAMLTVKYGGREKSFSWDYSYMGGIGLRSNRTATEAKHGAAYKEHPQHQQMEQESADATEPDLPATAKSASGGGDPLHIPRSMSCSSLSMKRTLFHRSSSRDGLSEGTTRREKTAHRRVLGRRGVSFDTQVKMVLIPKRDEFNDAERANLWWSRDDYSRFRQVLIDWKRRNIHRISHTDNILSIDLTDIDEDDIAHEESVPVNAMEATAAAAASAAAAAAAAAMAAATAASAAAATAAAAAAATAAEVAASHAREESKISAPGREGDPPAGKPAETVQEGIVSTSVDPATRDEAGSPRHEGREASGIAAGEADIAGGGNQEVEAVNPPDRVSESAALAGKVEEHETHEGDKDEKGLEPVSSKEACGRGRHVRFLGSFSSKSEGAVASIWSSGGPGSGMSPLRRSFSISEAHSPSSVRLKAVPLSEKQATMESLRTWRESLDNRLAHSSINHSDERGRSMSLQHPRATSYKDNGQESAMLRLDRELDSDVHQDGISGTQRGDQIGIIADNLKSSTGKDREEPQASPIMVAFERARKEDLARQAEVEAERAASAAAMVEAAAAAAAAAVVAVAAEAAAVEASKAEDAGPGTSQATEHNGRGREGVGSDDVEEEGPGGGSQVINLGLNDSPESAAVAAAAGIRMAAEGVSNLSLRARDSVENLQEMAEHGWGQVALSSSA